MTTGLKYGPLAMIAEFEMWMHDQTSRGHIVTDDQINAYVARQEHPLMICVLTQYIEARDMLRQQELARSN